MQSITHGQLEKNKGLVGDRYHAGTGFWHPVESCMLTLIGSKDLERANKRLGRPLLPGEHRRNLVIDGIHAVDLKGQSFHLGDALLAFQKPRPPCGYLNQLTNSNLSKALGKHSGICVSVLQSGIIRVGDELRFHKT